MHHVRSRFRRPAMAATGSLAGMLLLSGVVLTPAAAQDAIPTVPAASSCTIAPRETPIWDGIEIAEPTAPVSVAGPFVPPSGDPVDDAIRSAVTATIFQSIACQNAGDLGRMLALFSDDGVRAFFSGPRGFDAEAVGDAVEAGATPVSGDRMIELVAIDDIVAIEDGRVAATVTTRASDLEYADVVFLSPAPEGTGVQWLIDDSIAIDSQTQVEGGATEIPQ
ncbi:MAG TPA: hypothetical protein VGT61_08150 [Thermomicrobiales bacterium]|nr:hypothetical protein [Thermomicrobiales bacterium]